MKLNAKTVLEDLKGNPLKDSDSDVVTIGVALANILVADDSGGKMKLYILGQKLYKGQGIDVDPSDLALMKSATEKTKVYNNLVTGQVLMELEKVK